MRTGPASPGLPPAGAPPPPRPPQQRAWLPGNEAASMRRWAEEGARRGAGGAGERCGNLRDPGPWVASPELRGRARCRLGFCYCSGGGGVFERRFCRPPHHRRRACLLFRSSHLGSLGNAAPGNKGGRDFVVAWCGFRLV
ncbi:hypothetical protein HPB50_015679 [Hyalomma asiaticum]|uniref:Uncharacterized protein n=1 Tax=Hyalomma asiaticum TaxID=266040 RepID=A0ACB7T0W2_HYAAI|nr:hypothetical protein HPB50_015679 [Hyalomma asiaticum]